MDVSEQKEFIRRKRRMALISSSVATISLLLLFVGYVLFKEKLSGAVGIALGFAAIILLSLSTVFYTRLRERLASDSSKFRQL